MNDVKDSQTFKNYFSDAVMNLNAVCTYIRFNLHAAFVQNTHANKYCEITPKKKFLAGMNKLPVIDIHNADICNLCVFSFTDNPHWLKILPDPHEV